MKEKYNDPSYDSLLYGLFDNIHEELNEKMKSKYKDIEEEFTLWMEKGDHGKYDHIVQYIDASRFVRNDISRKMDMLFDQFIKVERDNLSDQNKFFLDSIKNGTLKKFVRPYIEVNEGLACGGDKENFIIGGVAKSIIDNIDNISFSGTYADAGRPDMDKEGKIPYWCPKSVLSTTELYNLMTAHRKLTDAIFQKEGLEKAIDLLK